MQALILVGGEGTRLRPLTSSEPKPVVPLAGRPFITYMVQWLQRHGVDDVILSSGFMAASLQEVLGDGRELGVTLRYVEEPIPLGTGGALKFAEDLLQERFFMLNGDVLTDIDLSAGLRQHERTAARVTLALTPVEDPSAYGLVRRNPDSSVREFLEKPSADQIDTNLVNAGAYILEREVLAAMPAAGRKVSIERDVFPRLVGAGLFGYEARGYWLDIGTPQRYLQGTFDVLEGNVATEVGHQLSQAGGSLVEDTVEGRVVAPALVGAGSVISASAIVGGRVVLGRGVTVGDGARVESSVVLDGASIGPGATVTGSVVGRRTRVGERCRVEECVVLGDDVELGADNMLSAGARIFPGVRLSEGAIGF